MNEKQKKKQEIMSILDQIVEARSVYEVETLSEKAKLFIKEFKQIKKAS